MDVAITDRETARIRAVEACEILDTPREARFDRLVYTAAQLFRTPIALFAVIGSDRVWVKAGVGPLPREWPRDVTFCQTVIELGETLVVENATTDVRFARLPNVIGPPFVRFYAGAPVRSTGNSIIGSLCILDVQPRALPERVRQQLIRFARDTESLLHLPA